MLRANCRPEADDRRDPCGLEAKCPHRAQAGDAESRHPANARRLAGLLTCLCQQSRFIALGRHIHWNAGLARNLERLVAEILRCPINLDQKWKRGTPPPAVAAREHVHLHSARRERFGERNRQRRLSRPACREISHAHHRPAQAAHGLEPRAQLEIAQRQRQPVLVAMRYGERFPRPPAARRLLLPARPSLPQPSGRRAACRAPRPIHPWPR